jgi:hypothetical protein
MESLFIKGKHGAFFTPTVNFDTATGKCEILGQSYLENTNAFYKDLLAWMKQYIEEQKGPVHLKLYLTYFNTSSSKCIAELLWMIKDYESSGGKVKVAWHYEDWDEDMLKEGEDFADETGLNIEFIPEEVSEEEEGEEY